MVTTYKDFLRKNEVATATPTNAKSHEQGDVYALDIWSRLRRFLIIGSAVGTYYVGAEMLTGDNTKVIEAALATDPDRAISTIHEIGMSFVAPKHDPVLYALAVAARFEYGNMEANKKYRARVYDCAVECCRIWTHVSHFLTYRSAAGISGRGQRRFVRKWFASLGANKAVYQAIKYPSRDGWAQRDALILARPKPVNQANSIVYKYLLDGSLPDLSAVSELPNGRDLIPLFGVEAIKYGLTNYEAAGISKKYRLPREALPTELLNDPMIWDALLDDMPYTALIRNLNKMTAVGLLTPTSQATMRVVAMLTEEERIRGSRVHPFTILTALRQYQEGKGERGKLTWNPVSDISWALDAAFYKAFKNVQPTGKRILIGLDVSSSMGATAGNTGMSCREVEAAMALVTLNIEENATVIGYTERVYDLQHRFRPNMMLLQAVAMIADHPAGWTNCAAPIQWAMQNGLQFDAFINYTDNETNDQPGNVARVLQSYRERYVPNARHVVVAGAANGISISDPNDFLSLDIAGFGSDVPAVIGEFVRGRL